MGKIKRGCLDWSTTESECLKFPKRIWILEDEKVKLKILNMTHDSTYNVHLDNTKMWRNLWRNYQWPRMKKDIASFVQGYLIYQQTKIEHQKPGGLLQKTELLVWKSECITMDFVMGLPKTQRKNYAIQVNMDRLTKYAHFLPYQVKQTTTDMAQQYTKEIVKLHGILVSIMSDWDPRFQLAFQKNLQESMGTKFKCNTTFHPQIDGQSKHVHQNSKGIERSNYH